MSECRKKITANGKLTIPASLQRQLDNNKLRIYSLKHSLKKAQSLVKQYKKNKSLVSILKDIRKNDAEADKSSRN